MDAPSRSKAHTCVSSIETSSPAKHSIFGLLFQRRADPICLRRSLLNREALWRRIHPEDRDRVCEETLRALHWKRDYRVAHRILLPYETVKYLESTDPVRHFWPLRNQRFFCSRLRSELLVERLGTHTRRWVGAILRRKKTLMESAAYPESISQPH